MSTKNEPAIFLEAARLYAENYDLVELMKKEFESNLDEFFDAVRQAAGGGDVLTQTTTGANRMWWLTSENGKKFPYLWFKARQPSVIVARQLEVCVYLEEGTTRDDTVALRAALRGKPLPASVTTLEATRALVMKLDISLAQYDDLVVGLAEDLVEVLELLTTTWHEVQRAA